MPDVDGMMQLVRRQALDEVTTLLQGQAYEIILAVLDDPAPELDEVKHRLHRCLAAHPHAPELALLAHLMETSELVNAEGDDVPA